MEIIFKEIMQKAQAQREALEIWNNYKKQIKDFCKNDKNKQYDNACPFENFDKILNCLLKHTCELSAQKFYRARAVPSIHFSEMNFTCKTKESNGIYGFETKNMGPPPPEAAGENRANPKNTSYLYLASTPARACAETRPVYQGYISLAEFKLQEKITIINLVNNSYSSSGNYFDFYLIGFIMNEFIKPVTSEYEIEYALSQYIAWALKKNNIAGIKYGFTDENCEEYNLVLFDEKLVKPTTEYSSLFQCIEQKYSFIDLNSPTPDKIIKSDFLLEYLTISEWQEKISELIQAIRKK